MVNATPTTIGASVAHIAAVTSAQVYRLDASAFAHDAENILDLPPHSSDPASLVIRRAKSTGPTPTSLLAVADPIVLARLASHLTALARLPVVVHVATGADHAAITSLFRSAGLVLLYSSSADEVQRHALIAAKIARSGHGVVHWFDDANAEVAKPLTTSALSRGREWAAKEVSLRQSNGTANGHVNGDAAHVPDVEAIVDAAFASLPKAFGAAPLHAHTGGTQTDQLVIILARSEAVEAVHNALPRGTGLLSLSLFEPLSARRLASLVPESIQRILVIEQAHSPTTRWAPLFLEVLGLIGEQPDREAPPRVTSRILGSSVSGVSEALVAGLAPDAPVEGGCIGEILPQPRATVAPQIPKHEQAYIKLLEQLFASRLDFANRPGPGQSAATSVPEYALGKLLAEAHSRSELQKRTRALVEDPTSSLDHGLRRAMSEWLAAPDSPALAAVVAEKLSGSSTDLEAHKGDFLRKSSWIVGSDAWAQDLGSSGVHHLISSGVDANLLVIDSQPYPGLEAVQDPERRGKKDIGLYAMNYGGVFVASVAVYGDYSQTVRALTEADRFKGPSVVVAYLPGGDKDALRALDVLKETKRAIDSGFWPLYRWDPSRDVSATSSWRVENHSDPFQLDSERIKLDLRQFLDRQNHLTLLSRQSPQYTASLTDSRADRVQTAREDRARQAYEKLSSSSDGPPLLVLFASDGGNAEKVAKRLAMRARARGLGVRIDTMDSQNIEDLTLEPHVALVTSTAGQGEFPQNGRKFWKALQEVVTTPADPKGAEMSRLSSVKFSVFAMGDSHYWPRPEDSKYYNKSGRDLDRKMEELGAERFADLGLGDDQDPDGAQTAYKLWEPLLWKALGVEGVDVVEAEPEPITNEHIKIASNFLRGTIAEGLADTSTGALAESDGQLTKFHGIYQQDDRDIRDQRKEEGLEPAYSFMVRVRMPAGVCRPDQWLQIDSISDTRGNSTFKLTTRQTFQFHGIIKRQLKPAIQEINKAMLDTIAACGDVNRNVMCTANPSIGELHRQVFEFSKNLSEHLLPHTAAYAEIWLDKKLVAGDAVKDFEPLYGKLYLPRKFKINVAVPPNNDVDIYTADVGFIAIEDGKGHLAGFNVTIGGGMGVTHGNKKTYPRLGDVIGYISTAKAIDVAEKIMLTQRDHGDRSNRKHARLKYTIDDMGLDAFKADVEKRLGYRLEAARNVVFTHNTDAFGWQQGDDGNWHFTAFIENGRVADEPGKPFKTGLREIAKIHKGVFRLTPNQHLVISDVASDARPQIEQLLKKYHLDKLDFTGLRLSSSACVAFPTCGLAMAESERYLPVLIDKVEKICEDAGLRNDAIVMRMTGCPNGCARPYVAEVAFVGKAPGTYQMYLGGGQYGQRMTQNKIYRETVEEADIPTILGPMIRSYAKLRQQGEAFGDFCIRQRWISPTTSGLTFYEGMGPTHAPIEA